MSTKTYTLPKITSLYCIKGSIKLGLCKNRVYPVLEVSLVEDYRVKIVIQKQKQDRQLTVYARHPNRLTDENGFNVNNGWNNQYPARFKLQAERQ